MLLLADIVEADMQQITGTPPADATLWDIATVLNSPAQAGEVWDALDAKLEGELFSEAVQSGVSGAIPNAATAALQGDAISALQMIESQTGSGGIGLADWVVTLLRWNGYSLIDFVSAMFLNQSIDIYPSPLFCNDSGLSQNNQPVGDILAELFEIFDGTPSGNASDDADGNVRDQLSYLGSKVTSVDGRLSALDNTFVTWSLVEFVYSLLQNSLTGGGPAGSTYTGESPLFCNDATMTMDNQPVGDILAELHEIFDGTPTSGNAAGDQDGNIRGQLMAANQFLAQTNSDIEAIDGSFMPWGMGTLIWVLLQNSLTGSGSVTGDSPLYCNDSGLSQDNEPIGDVLAELFEIFDGTPPSGNATGDSDGNVRDQLAAIYGELQDLDYNGFNVSIGEVMWGLLSNDTTGAGPVFVESPLFCNDASLSQDDEPVGDILASMHDGPRASKTDWAQLTAPGTTSSFQPPISCIHHVLQITVASIDTDVTVSLEGSVDGSNWYTLGSSLAVTANGTHAIQAEGLAPYVRGNFVSETGGTNATVDFDYHGSR